MRQSHLCSLPEKEFVNVGAMNLRVAHSARLILRALVVERRHARHIAARRRSMALQAQQVHLADAQQAWIG